MNEAEKDKRALSPIIAQNFFDSQFARADRPSWVLEAVQSVQEEVTMSMRLNLASAVEKGEIKPEDLVDYIRVLYKNGEITPKHLIDALAGMKVSLLVAEYRQREETQSPLNHW